MAIGFIYNGSDYATPDKSMTRNSKPSVQVAKFGDGYEQRIIKGINNIAEEYSVSFRQREKAFIDDVITFLDDKAGVTHFIFRIPDTNSSGNEKAIKVVCDSYSTVYEYGDYYSLTATLRRVFEA